MCKVSKTKQLQDDKNQRLLDSCKIGINQVWGDKAIELTLDAIQHVSRIEDRIDPDLGIVQQIQRALVSVPSNVAEGLGRCDYQQRIQFLKIARGSAYEAAVQALIIADRDLVDKVELLCYYIDGEIISFMENFNDFISENK